ncbi:MAG: class I SAM-dependent methyltransferase [Trueperaceae bacterium]|nr:class I SAM-dependent methyltransferase [Trueperaceae bacterium]
MPFLDLGTTPLADRFPASPDEHETKYPLGLIVCRSCWLVQNSYVVPGELLYSEDYGFYTGASPSLIAYYDEYARWAIKQFSPRSVVEIASNDGTLLWHFKDAGCAVVGVEPAVTVAESSGLPVIIEPFGREIAATIGKADLVVANNVVAHVSDLDDFVGGIADLLSDDGHAVIECQYLPDLLLGNQFDHVYHEHRSFFSVTTLASTFKRHGLRLNAWMHTPAQGGSIRCVFSKGGERAKRPDERWLSSPTAYTGFQGRIDHLRSALVSLMRERRDEGPIGGYGATAKSTTLLNYCGIDSNLLDYVVDLTPGKQGRYTPGTHIPIVSPENEPGASTYLLLAWNYLSGILQRERPFTEAGGRFILPLPQPILL